jgi:tetratricopeptide (TPR) repeat protein
LKRDHFEVLGIDRTATEAEVREAYARFARVLHPDACQDPSLTDLREKRDAVFSRLSQAFETLRDPESRARYEQAYEPSKLRPAGTFRPPKSPPPERTPPTAAPTPSAAPTPAVSGSAAPTSPPPSPPPPSAARSPSSPPVLDARLEPEHVLSVAQQLYEEERYWDAIQQLEPLIVRATGSARMRAAMLLAQAYLKNPMWKKRAEELLQRVVRENPQHVPALLLLADLYHASNLQARAKAAYRRVLELDPDNREARSRLGALEPAGGGGLRSFFKRR